MTRPAPTGAREPHRRTPGARPLPGCGQDGGVTVRAVPAVRRVRWNQVMKAAQATDTSGAVPWPGRRPRKAAGPGAGGANGVCARP